MHDVSILEAFSVHLQRDCRDNALGTCLVYEIQRFVEALEMYEQIANFPIKELFCTTRFEEGLPKSVILQKEKIAWLMGQDSDSRLPSLNASMQRGKSINSSVSKSKGTFKNDIMRSSAFRQVTLGAGKQMKKKLPKNSLAAALLKITPGINKYQQINTYDDILDELTCYIERTVQLFWLTFKTGLFTNSKNPSSLIFRLFHQAKDHYKL